MRMEEWSLPTIRLRPKSGGEVLLGRSAQVATILVGVAVFFAIVDYGQPLFAPIALAFTVGLMLSPLARRVEAVGIPPAVSAALVTLIFLLLVAIGLFLFALPLSTWLQRLPLLWSRVQTTLSGWREQIGTISDLGRQLKDAMGGDAGNVVVEEASDPVGSIAWMAPAIIGQMLLFLGSLYFFIAARDSIRMAVLRICMNRRARWRAARIFRDTERLVSRYLLSITVINVGLGLAVGCAMWALQMPSPFLWGALAGVLNYIVYIGPIATAAIILTVSLASYDGVGILLPVSVYLFINMIEAQFVTPYVIGRAMTLNPLVVFLAITFWLWLWGPVGGFVAVPFLLIAAAMVGHLFPSAPARRDGTKLRRVG